MLTEHEAGYWLKGILIVVYDQQGCSRLQSRAAYLGTIGVRDRKVFCSDSRCLKADTIQATTANGYIKTSWLFLSSKALICRSSGSRANFPVCMITLNFRYRK